MTREDKNSGSARVTYLELCIKTKQALLEVDDKIKWLLKGRMIWFIKEILGINQVSLRCQTHNKTGLI